MEKSKAMKMKEKEKMKDGKSMPKEVDEKKSMKKPMKGKSKSCR